MKIKPRVHRHRVVLRPRARRMLWAQRAAFAAMLILACMAAALLRRMPPQMLSLSEIKVRATPRIDDVQIEGAPDMVAQDLLNFARISQGPLAARAEALRRRFNFLARATAHHDWLAHRARFDVALRRPVAVALRRGFSNGYLDADGVLFVAPSGLYSLSGPVVDVTGASDADDKALARCLADIARSPDLTAPLDKMRFVSALDGWQAEFHDGTLVSWGNLEWTSEKLSRLRQALLDARSRTPSVGVLTADLRYFEDGKIILKTRPANG